MLTAQPTLVNRSLNVRDVIEQAELRVPLIQPGLLHLVHISPTPDPFGAHSPAMESP
jgi:hypothetical protein